MSKEEACRLLLEAAAEGAAAEAAAGGAGGAGAGGEPPGAARIRAAALPDKLLRRAMQALLEHVLALDEPGWAGWARAATRLVRAVKRAPAAELLRALLPGAGAAPPPRLAALLAHAARERLLALHELAAWPGPPLLLLDVLQQLRDLAGLDELQDLYKESKVTDPPDRDTGVETL